MVAVEVPVRLHTRTGRAGLRVEDDAHEYRGALILSHHLGESRVEMARQRRVEEVHGKVAADAAVGKPHAPGKPAPAAARIQPQRVQRHRRKQHRERQAF